MKLNAKIIAAIVILVLGLTIATSQKQNTTNTSTGQGSSVQELSYQGQDGKTALELAKAKYQVETISSSYGEYVSSINGVKAGDTSFWAFYVNGQMATVGAGDYKTASAETITWRLESIQ